MYRYWGTGDALGENLASATVVLPAAIRDALEAAVAERCHDMLAGAFPDETPGVALVVHRIGTGARSAFASLAIVLAGQRNPVTFLHICHIFCICARRCEHPESGGKHTRNGQCRTLRNLATHRFLSPDVGNEAVASPIQFRDRSHEGYAGAMGEIRAVPHILQR